MEEEKNATTTAEDLEVRPPRSQPMLAQESLIVELPTTIPNVVHYALAQGLEALDYLSVGNYSSHDAFEQVKEDGIV